MAAATLLKRLTFGAAGIACTWYISTRYVDNRVIHALGYGADVFEGKKTKWDRNWDKRSPASLVPKKDQNNNSTDDNSSPPKRPTAKRHLILIRHGQYVLAENSEDKILTKLGRIQAAATGRRLKELSLPYTTLHYSTMVRATETAQLILESLPADLPTKSTDMLREGAPIEPEPPSRHWKPERWEFHEDGARIEAAFRRFFHRADPEQSHDTTEVIVCHGNVIRYFVCRALQLPPEAWLRISLAHCSITRLTIRPNGLVSLQSLGDSGHLPPNEITFS